MPVTDRRLGETGQGNGKADEIESNLRDFVRREGWAARSDETVSDNANSLVQRLSTGSIDEVERVIGELITVRDMLRSEGERVQREINNYQALSEVAIKSMKIVAESLGQWQREQQRLNVESFKGKRH